MLTLTRHEDSEKIADALRLLMGSDHAVLVVAFEEMDQDMLDALDVLFGEGNAQRMAGYPCAVCGYERTCGEPPGEDCHS